MRYTTTRWPNSGSPVKKWHKSTASLGRIDSLHADQHQTLRITVTTLPSTVASLPGMGSKAGLCGINHT
ncbi:Uncharacterised protein [Mycobacterium tuberculosis]|nr:Uncharacterised protein [Mycobacterium tuberculosis]CNL94389.1 Uncharacterised protein [Mycobacterium tuberculosis]CNM39051.1 Uncharacterised protein [Mycobacterium tuberculosis]CNM43557.1 Uncharacterised protein [Mycobacterium tuberculosis]CNN08982.1 Uncharacterised protein [Mycobacterium tuberculosis]